MATGPRDRGALGAIAEEGQPIDLLLHHRTRRDSAYAGGSCVAISPTLERQLRIPLESVTDLAVDAALHRLEEPNDGRDVRKDQQALVVVE